MHIANQSGISVCRVTKPSKKPAIIKKGIVLITIFKPALIPFTKDVSLVNVFGNKIPCPTTKPAQPAMMITEISIVP